MTGRTTQSIHEGTFNLIDRNKSLPSQRESKEERETGNFNQLSNHMKL
jgi:hypothetical protein